MILFNCKCNSRLRCLAYASVRIEFALSSQTQCRRRDGWRPTQRKRLHSSCPMNSSMHRINWVFLACICVNSLWTHCSFLASSFNVRTGYRPHHDLVLSINFASRKWQNSCRFLCPFTFVYFLFVCFQLIFVVKSKCVLLLCENRE